MVYFRGLFSLRADKLLVLFGTCGVLDEDDKDFYYS